MRRTIRTGPIDIDQIVANYTALGRAERRKRSRKRWLRAGLATAAAAAAGLAWLAGLPGDVFRHLRVDGGGDLRALVQTELVQLSAARAELAAERGRYADKARELEGELAAFAARHAELEAQQRDLSVQSTELRAALERVDAERAALVAARAQSPDVERELLAIGEQRRALEQRSQTFVNQGRQLSTELEALERQRDALEAERAAMERQRRDLEALLGAAAAGPSASGAESPENPLDALAKLDLPETTFDPREPAADVEPLFASAVDASALGEMRGGVQLPNGMNVAIGLTRTASINGEEQLGSSLHIDDLTAGLSPATLDALRPVVIQNGEGNSVSTQLLDGWSGGIGTFIQNSRDNQEISTATIYDVSIQDVAPTIRDMAASQAVSDSLLFHP